LLHLEISRPCDGFFDCQQLCLHFSAKLRKIGNRKRTGAGTPILSLIEPVTANFKLLHLEISRRYDGFFDSYASCFSGFSSGETFHAVLVGYQ